MNTEGQMADDKTPSPQDLLAAVLEKLNHNHPTNEGWDGDFPDLKYLSAALGREVTATDILEVDSEGYPRKQKRIEPDNGPDKETEIATAPPAAPKPEPINVEQRQAEKAKIEELLHEAFKVEAAAKAKRVDLEQKRDFIISQIDQVAKQSLSEMHQKLFAANDKVNADRVAQLNKFREATGGVIPAKFASKMDEAAANKRSVMRRATRLGLGG